MEKEKEKERHMVKMDEYLKKDEAVKPSIYSSKTQTKDVVVCPSCKTENPVEAGFCISCGYKFSRELPFNIKEEHFTREDKANLTEKVHKLSKIRFSRKEKKEILDMEYDRIASTQTIVTILALVGIGYLFFLYINNPSDWVFVIVILIGTCMCIPIGMVIGWYALDPYMRCKALRRFGKKNYGILNLVGKGQKIVSKVKNFDQAIIWKKDECWVLSKQYLYQLSKDGNSIIKKKMIDPECIVTLVNTIPVLFVDIDSFEPLRLSTEGREPINPMEMASQMNAWVDNQIEKEQQGKKKFDILLVACILITVVAIVMVFITMTKVDDLKIQLDMLRQIVEKKGMTQP